MLTYTNLQKGTTFIINGEPYEVLDYNFVRMQQRKPVVQVKVRNLISGKVLPKTFHQSDSFQETDIEKKEAVFVYSHRGKFVFAEPNNPKNRFELDAGIIEEQTKFLKPNLPLTTYIFKEKIINIALPIKVDYKVKSAPPSIKGDTATGGNKFVVLENDLEIAVPMFIKEGDTVRINTQSGEYTERVEKK